MPAKVTVPAAGARTACAGVGADVDPAVLPGGVRVRGVEDERLQDRAVDRPRPRAGDRREDEHRDDSRKQHRRRSLLQVLTPGRGAWIEDMKHHL